MKEVPFLIIGGGIGGLTAALCIAKTGRTVTVLEQEEKFSEIGAGLQLAPNAMRILHQLGLFESVQEFAWFPKRLVLMDCQSGQELAALDLGKEFRARYEFPYAVMHRADLLNLLYQACQATGLVTLLAHRTVVSTEDKGDYVDVGCQEGFAYRAQAVIGADGLWSRTRQLFSDDRPIIAEYVAYRGAIPIEEVKDYARMDDVVMWIGKDVHFVQYPVRRGELYNQVAVFKSLRYTPDTDDWGTPEELDQVFSQSCDKVQHAIRFMHRGRRWPMMDRRPINRWTSGRVALLGDAAHPMLQYIAQGACQAIEDAACLGDKIITMGDDPSRIFLAYQTERLQRTARVQTAARNFGQIIHTGDSAAILLRDYLLTTHTPNNLGIVDWIYGYGRPTP